MEASNYPGNSHSRETKKVQPEKQAPAKLQPVVQGKVVRRKKPLGKRFAETFIQGGDAQSVWSYIAFDVMIPAARDMVVDAIQQGAERAFYGEARPRSRRGSRGSDSRATFVSYDKFANQGSSRRDEPRMSRRAKATHDFDEIVLETRAEADEVLDRMFDRLSQYELVTVADFYDLLNQPSDFVDREWGWTNLQGARAARAHGGYVLELPRPEKL